MTPETQRIYQEIMDDFAEREAAISFPMIVARMRGRGCQVSEQDVLDEWRREVAEQRTRESENL